MSVTDSEHYTQFLSLSRPVGEDVFEFLIVTRDQIGVTSKITGEIARHNIDILTIDGAYDPGIERFVFTLFCDFAKADCTPDLLMEELRKFDFVTKIDYASAKGRLFDRFYFPMRIMAKHRAILMRVSPFLKVERRLREALGSAGDAVLFEEGKTYAHETFVHLRNALPHASLEEMLQNVVDGLRATGWGLFEFRRERDVFHVSIRNPPMIEEQETETHHSMFVSGVATGATESLYGLELVVRNANYDKGMDTLKFTLEKYTE